MDYSDCVAGSCSDSAQVPHKKPRMEPKKIDSEYPDLTLMNIYPEENYPNNNSYFVKYLRTGVIDHEAIKEKSDFSTIVHIGFPRYNCIDGIILTMSRCANVVFLFCDKNQITRIFDHVLIDKFSLLSETVRNSLKEQMKFGSASEYLKLANAVIIHQIPENIFDDSADFLIKLEAEVKITTIIGIYGYINYNKIRHEMKIPQRVFMLSQFPNNLATKFVEIVFDNFGSNLNFLSQMTTLMKHHGYQVIRSRFDLNGTGFIIERSMVILSANLNAMIKEGYLKTLEDVDNFTLKAGFTIPLTKMFAYHDWTRILSFALIFDKENCKSWNSLYTKNLQSLPLLNMCNERFHFNCAQLNDLMRDLNDLIDAAEEPTEDPKPCSNDFSLDELADRFLLRYASEMMNLYKNGTVEKISETDIAIVYGLGFSYFYGGPFRFVKEHVCKFVDVIKNDKDFKYNQEMIKESEKKIKRRFNIEMI